MSLSVIAAESKPEAVAMRLEAVADRLDDEVLGPLVVVLALLEQAEDPARQHLLDRAVERHRGELRA